MNVVRFAPLFLFLSGAASLIYQVAWVRLLGLSIGSTSVSVSLVVGTFFSGLALGSFLTTRLPRRYLTRIEPYLWVELLMGVSALVLLPLLLNLDRLVAAWPVVGEVLAFKLVLVVLVLALPSLCIGATYPMMASLMARRQATLGQTLGKLYAVNTGGAVAGALLGGFVLIPLWGLDGAVYVAAAFNGVIVLLGFVYCRKDLFPPPDVKEACGRTGPPRRRVLFVLFITGLVALACEVAWTKYLAIFVHTTIYGFSAVLAIFLSGIALGAWLIKGRLDRLGDGRSQQLGWLLALAVALLLARSGLEYLPQLYGAWVQDDDGAVVEALKKYGLILLVLWPPTMLLGALFSLNIRLQCGSVRHVAGQAGVAYAVNTLGGIAGSLLAGLWLIPLFGSDLVLSLAVVVVVLTALLFIEGDRLRRSAAWAAVVLVLAGVIYLPHLDFRTMITASRYYFDPERRLPQPPRFVFLEEGRSSVVSVTTLDHRRFRLQSNSLPEALVAPPDPFPWLSESFLGVLPYLMRESPRRAFIIGLGAGNTLSAAALTPLESIDVVEIEPAVARATDHIFDGGLPALKDPRVTLHFDDARHRLLIDRRRYDAIISQPSHPWLAGAGNLFTQEFFQIVADHLSPDGVSVQWLNLFNMDATTLRSILNAYFSVFPYGMTFLVQYENSLILVGSKAPLRFEQGMIQARLKEPSIEPVLSRWRFTSAYELYRYFSLSRAEALEAAGESIANSDTRLIPEVRLAWLDQRPRGEEGVIELLAAHYRFDVLSYLDSTSPARLDRLGRYLLSKRDYLRYDLLRRQRARMEGERR